MTNHRCEAILNGKCYYILGTAGPFEGRARVCYESGGTLATIKSQAEEDVVRAVADGSEVWIGLRDIDTNTLTYDFEWMDSTSFDDGSDFENWDTAEPLQTSADVAVVSKSSGWDAIAATGSKKAVCQSEMRCTHEFEGSCYYVSPFARTYSQAQGHCNERGFHLVTINSDAENEYIKTLTHWGDVYIGYQDSRSQWTDGTPLTFGEWADGSAWGSSYEPFGGAVPAGEAATYMDAGTGDWVPDAGSANRYFICEREL